MDVDDNSGCITVGVFGSIAEKIMGCIAVNLMEQHTGKVKCMFLNLFRKIDALLLYIFSLLLEHLPFFQTLQVKFQKKNGSPI